MRIALAGGGTGGHVFPIKSMIQYLYHPSSKEYLEQTESLVWFGTKNSLEQEVAQASFAQYPALRFIPISAGKYRRETPLKSKIKNIRDLFLFAGGIIQSLFWLIKLRIDVVFCKGGFVALPVVIAAWILRKKVIVHESDTHAGLVNKIAARMADKVFVAFEGVFPKADIVGQILSDDIVVDKKDILPPRLQELAHLDTKKTRIFVTGGSQGSQRLYQSLIKALETDKSIQHDFLFFIALGKLNEQFQEQFAPYENVKCYDFLSQKEIGTMYDRCDIALTRAGTTSLAEQKLYGMLLFIVPIAWTHDQYENADWYVNHYGDILIDQKEDNFLNKLIVTCKHYKTYKKHAQEKDKIAELHRVKHAILRAIFHHDTPKKN